MSIVSMSNVHTKSPINSGLLPSLAMMYKKIFWRQKSVHRDIPRLHEATANEEKYKKVNKSNKKGNKSSNCVLH